MRAHLMLGLLKLHFDFDLGLIQLNLQDCLLRLCRLLGVLCSKRGSNSLLFLPELRRRICTWLDTPHTHRGCAEQSSMCRTQQHSCWRPQHTKERLQNMEGDLHQHVYAALLPCSVCNLQAPVVGLKPCVQLRACAPRGLPGGAGFRSNAACLPHSTPLPTRTPVPVNLSDLLLAFESTSATSLINSAALLSVLLPVPLLPRPGLLPPSH